MTVSPQHHLEFLQRMGHTVREVHGTHWFNTSRGVYTSVPYHHEIDACSIDLTQVLGRDGLAAKFGCPASQGVDSFRIVCNDRDYDFASLRSRVRTQVRRGLEQCRVEQVDFDLLHQSAIPLNVDTLIRQGRKIPSDHEAYWTRYFSEAARTEGAEAWAAFVGNSLAAYLIAFTIEDVCNLLIVRSSLQFLDAYPNNALIFQFLHSRMRTPGIRCVSYGFESIQSDLRSLDQFKTGMGFQKIPIGQRIELSAWLRPFFNRYTTPMAQQILKSLGRGENGAKMRGLLHWYNQQPRIDSRQKAARAA